MEQEGACVPYYSEIHSKVELPGMLGIRRKGNVGKSGVNGITGDMYSGSNRLKKPLLGPCLNRWSDLAFPEWPA